MVKRFEMNHKGLPEFDEKGVWVLYEDFAELQRERDALAAENAVLDKAIGSISDTYETGVADILAEEIDKAVNLETPATDAFLNSVRADAIKDFCKLLEQYGKVEPHQFDPNFADLYANINKKLYESILDNPAVFDMESLVDWLECGANDSRAYADMAIESTTAPKGDSNAE